LQFFVYLLKFRGNQIGKHSGNALGHIRERYQAKEIRRKLTKRQIFKPINYDKEKQNLDLPINGNGSLGNTYKQL